MADETNPKMVQLEADNASLRQRVVALESALTIELWLLVHKTLRLLRVSMPFCSSPSAFTSWPKPSAKSSVSARCRRLETIRTWGAIASDDKSHGKTYWKRFCRCGR